MTIISKKIIVAILFFTFFVGVKSASAQPYTPGETLNPACAPGAVDCVVTTLTAQDESVDLSGNVLTLNFAGSGVTSSILNGVVTVTIPGGSGGLTSLNGLTGDTQTFALGTTGTDIAWSSSGTTHTLNVPTASASNRGLLSSANWTTFNNKLGSLNGLTGATQTFAVGTSGTNFTISSSGTTHTFNLPTASSTVRGLLSTSNWTTFNNKQDALPSQTGNAGEFLTTDGSSLSWSAAGDGAVAIGTSGTTLYSPGLAAGEGNTATGFNVILGQEAGDGSTSAAASVFIGPYAGGSAQASGAVFIGDITGGSATNANHSIFLGPSTGYLATNASDSNFIGNYTGYQASSAANSNFMGYQAGYGAASAANSNFMGYQAGYNADNAVHSIFIGYEAGENDTVNNTVSGTSILIGDNTSTGGNQNSIALGKSATNTAANQMMIGSTASPIDSVVIKGSGVAICTITVGTSMACSSDERLKKNIVDLGEDTLDKVLQLKTVTYNWKEGNNTTEQIGFLAQDLEKQFPQLVMTDSVGYKSVYYSQITPILTQAIRQLKVKIDTLSDRINTLDDKISGLFEYFRTKEIQIDETLCLGDTCITEDQLVELLQMRNSIENQNNASSSYEPNQQTENEDPVPTEETQTELIEEENSTQNEEVVTEQQIEETEIPAEGEGSIDTQNNPPVE